MGTSSDYGRWTQAPATDRLTDLCLNTIGARPAFVVALMLTLVACVARVMA